MSCEVEPIIINTDELSPPAAANGLWENRAAAYSIYDAPGVPKVSICVTGYNRLSKTKYCVECVLKYTSDVDYELILVDNGSDDGTYEFFQSVEHKKKRIIKVTKNIGSMFPFSHVQKVFSGKYLVFLPNDVYVTQNWLSNILKCYESDPSVGFVVPYSSNVSNAQQIDLGFKNFDEMQAKAAAFNKSDPSKWEERMRLINLVNILSRPVLDTVGIFDKSLIHDFSEDDYAVRLRRNGYRLVLCGDTWICHDHDFRNMEDKDPAAFAKSLESGRRIYREKYKGVDAWDDINNFERELLSPLTKYKPRSDGVSALCVDVRCGTPVLEVRNYMRKRGIVDVASFAFTTNAKYFTDLQYITDETHCDRMDFIQEYYSNNSMDIVVLGEPINLYNSPITLMQKLFGFLKPGGILMFKLRNTNDYNSFLRSAGLGGVYDADLPSSMSVKEVTDCLTLIGGRDVVITHEHHQLSVKDQNTVLALLKKVNPNAGNNDTKRLFINNYAFKAVKG